MVALALVALAIAGGAAWVTAQDSSRVVWEPRASDWRTLVGGPGPESAPLRTVAGTLCLGANDLARLLDATKFWHGGPRKLVLRTPQHRLQFTLDNPFVVIDERTLLLPQPVRSLGGELQVPASIVDSLPADTTMPRLVIDSERNTVYRVPPSGIVGSPRVVVDGAVTRWIFPVDRPDEVVVAARSRAHFRLRFSGFFTGVLPRELPAGALADTVRTLRTASGSAFEIRVSARATGFRVESDDVRRRVVVEFRSGEGSGLESFAPDPPPGRRAVRVVVLDPGHGGSDAGVVAQGLKEKDLTLALARLLKDELQKRLKARVVLTREDDRALTAPERAERANRARADLVISIHMDGFAGARARGVTVYCPPATVGSADRDGGAGIVLLPWRDVAIRHAALAREAAEDVLSALELRSLGPTRLREVLPVPLLGVNAPGMMLECATLTAEPDHRRLSDPEGVRALAATIAEGIEAYQRGNP